MSDGHWLRNNSLLTPRTSWTIRGADLCNAQLQFVKGGKSSVHQRHCSTICKAKGTVGPPMVRRAVLKQDSLSAKSVRQRVYRINLHGRYLKSISTAQSIILPYPWSALNCTPLILCTIREVNYSFTPRQRKTIEYVIIYNPRIITLPVAWLSLYNSQIHKYCIYIRWILLNSTDRTCLRREVLGS